MKWPLSKEAKGEMSDKDKAMMEVKPPSFTEPQTEDESRMGFQVEEMTDLARKLREFASNGLPMHIEEEDYDALLAKIDGWLSAEDRPIMLNESFDGIREEVFAMMGKATGREANPPVDQQRAA